MIFHSGRLKQYRAVNDLSLDDVAKLTGVKKQTLHRYEKGNGSPTFGQIEKICAGLKVPFSFFTAPKMLVAYRGYKDRILVIDEMALKGLSLRIERVYGWVEKKEMSLSSARKKTRQLILDYLTSDFNNQHTK